MNIQQILRDLLNVIEKAQSEESEIEQVNTELTPVQIDTEELPIDIAQQEFDSEQDCGCVEQGCGCSDEESDFPELDVIKRNAGMMPMVISTDGPMA